jgi:Na+/proline symporter
VGYSVFFIDRVLYSFLLTETMATFVGVSIYAGLIWKRTNRWGALAGVVAAISANFTLYGLRRQRLDAWDPMVFSIALVSGIAATVLVSLLTPPEPEQLVRSFMVRVNTPSEGAETVPLPDRADTFATAKSGRQLIVPNLLHLRAAAAGFGWRAYRIDLKGFAQAWAFVIALVLLAWAIFHP